SARTGSRTRRMRRPRAPPAPRSCAQRDRSISGPPTRIPLPLLPPRACLPGSPCRDGTAPRRAGGSAWSAAGPGASVPFRTSDTATMQARFGRYELLNRLAGGGMGEVYLARQRGAAGFEKLLVIKTLLPHLCEDEEFIHMFQDEARISAQLIHPNLCQSYEFDQIEGAWYIAMEYLRGEDVRRLWKAASLKGLTLPV